MYDEAFYALETEVAVRSATHALPLIFQKINVRTVVDVGCGTGGWANVAESLGRVVVGVDHQVPIDLRIVSAYVDCDLTNGYPCAGFDLAICLEVAEHLPEESAIPLVTGLCGANAVLFSAATPGQQGVGHIHCRPHDYWHELFAQHGYLPEHVGAQWSDTVEDFYRRNAYLYTKEAT